MATKNVVTEYLVNVLLRSPGGREVLRNILTRLSGWPPVDYGNAPHVREIKVEHVLSKPWKPDSLITARRLLKKGRTPPPIHVSEYIYLGKSYFAVGDGNHRTESFREAGILTIHAKVEGSYRCKDSTTEFYRQFLAQALLRLPWVRASLRYRGILW